MATALAVPHPDRQQGAVAGEIDGVDPGVTDGEFFGRLLGVRFPKNQSPVTAA
jgi:hypothetical protein